MDKNLTAKQRFLPAKIDHLCLTKNERDLIKNISFELPDKGRTLIMGPNGAGKSLLLRLLHGLISPSSGSIHWQGQICNKDIQNSQAMVFQKPVMLRRSVKANLDYVLKLHDKKSGLKEKNTKQTIFKLLKLARLSNVASQPARLLSGGEQQRLAIARAIALEPAILFLDEPTSNMDLASTKQIEEMIRTIDEDGIKIVMVTHDIGQAKRLGDHILFLNEGELVCDQPGDTFFDSPAHIAAEKYLKGEF